jgi:predicted RNA-binding Zn ribbon-like protein
VRARDLLYSLFLARLTDRPAAPAELDQLSELADAAYRAGKLRPDDDGRLRWTWDRVGLTTVRHVAVTSAVDLLRELPSERLKQCPGEHCGWFFLDSTKRGNRRWCSMGECGQDAKDERRRALRQARAAPGEPRGEEGSSLAKLEI